MGDDADQAGTLAMPEPITVAPGYKQATCMLEEEKPGRLVLHDRWLRWELAATLAAIFGGAGLGYVVVPAFLRGNPAIILQLGFTAVVVLGAFAIVGVAVFCACCAEARPDPKPAEPGHLVLHDGETSYSLTDEMAQRRRRLPWEIAATLALIFGGAALGYVIVPASLRDSASMSLRLGFTGVLLLGIFAFTGVILCCAEAWPEAYGPKTEPKPLPLWLALLRVIGCWLLALPFSWICLLFVGVGIDDAVNGSPMQAAIWLAIGIAFGAGGFILIAGSGVAAGTDLRPGGKVPGAIRRSPWWRHVLWMLGLWAMLMTGLAVNYGIQGHWGDFCETLVVALGSWLALARAAGGAVPEDAFSG
jgi:hypothetical protein